MTSECAWTASSRGPISQPARQPVIAWDLERLPTVTTRSGNLAANPGTLPRGASPAYTSSATNHRSCRRASVAMRRARRGRDHAGRIIRRRPESARVRGVIIGPPERPDRDGNPHGRGPHEAAHRMPARSPGRSGTSGRTDDLIACSGKAHRCDEQRVLGARQIHDVVRFRGLSGALCVVRRNRRAHRVAAGCTRIMRITAANALDRPLDDGAGVCRSGSPTLQNDDIFAALARGRRLVMCQPRIRPLTADPIDEARVLHYQRPSMPCR